MLPLPRSRRQTLAAPRTGAVLVALIERPQGVCLLLTRRTEQTRYHKGQISLPGGAVEEGDATPWSAALREAHEEVGLESAAVMPLGALTPLYIPVSNYDVHPFIGWVQPPPATWRPSPAEVAEVIELPLRILLDPAAQAEETRTEGGRTMRAPYYRYGAHRVWGATAMILSEVQVLLAALGSVKEEMCRSMI